VADVSAAFAAEPAVRLHSPVQPCACHHPPAGPDWLHEIKHDGFRVLAFKDGERIKIWSRRGADFTDPAAVVRLFFAPVV
jgi:ATP-dependent DNA ligase